VPPRQALPVKLPLTEFDPTSPALIEPAAGADRTSA
jgi:hypothetical protein